LFLKVIKGFYSIVTIDGVGVHYGTTALFILVRKVAVAIIGVVEEIGN
jgi:hypothetical protein